MGQSVIGDHAGPGRADDDLYEDVEVIISATDFIEKTGGAQLLFHLTSATCPAPRRAARGLPRPGDRASYLPPATGGAHSERH
jgi:hypothetical protein